MLPLLYLVLLEHPGLERDALPFLILHRCGMVTIVVYVRAVILPWNKLQTTGSKISIWPKIKVDREKKYRTTGRFSKCMSEQ